MPPDMGAYAVISYKHLFDKPRAISIDELNVFGVPQWTIDELQDLLDDYVLNLPFPAPDADDIIED